MLPPTEAGPRSALNEGRQSSKATAPERIRHLGALASINQTRGASKGEKRLSLDVPPHRKSLLSGG
jgi:hypothetical protein